MRKEEFRNWMDGKIKARPISDCLSRCSRVERVLGVDLDDAYAQDQGEGVLSKLQYTIADERANKPYNPEFGFKEGACIRFRYTDLRSAVKKYFAFCSERNG